MSLAVILYFQLLAVGVIYGIVVCVRDARLRDHSPWLVCLLGVFLFPVGTLAWIAFRPPPRDPPAEAGTFSLEDHRLQ